MAAVGKRLVRAGAATLLGLALGDALLSLTLLRGGRLGDRSLAPYGIELTPRQEHWVADQRAQLARLTEGVAPEGTLVFDELLGWRTNAGQVDPEDGVRIGSDGTRGPRSYEREPPEGVLRIACFGESFTWGSVVSHRDSWPYLLEATQTGREVLNFGVPGFGTDQALLRMRRDGLGRGAQVMLMGLMLENIGRNVNRYRPRWYPPSFNCVAKPRFVLAGGELELVPSPFETHAELVEAVVSGRAPSLLAEHEHWREPGLGPLHHSSLARLAQTLWGVRRRSVPMLWRDTEGEPYRVTLALLEHFAAEARADGARAVAVVVFPRDADLEHRLGRGAPYWTEALADMRSRGLEVIDVATALAPVAREHDVRSLYRGGHLNEAGNRIAAATVERWLRSLGLFP